MDGLGCGVRVVAYHEPLQEERGLKPLELEHDHVAVALGFSPEDAVALGIRYASRGIMRGYVRNPRSPSKSAPLLVTQHFTT